MAGCCPTSRRAGIRSIRISRTRTAPISAITVFAFSTVFNTSQVSDAEAPRDAVDFLDPKFKDRIVLTYPHDDDAVLYQFDRIVSEQGWSYMDKLLAQNVRWVRGSAPARVAVEKGDKAVTFTASGPLTAPANSTVEIRLAEERQLPVVAAASRDLQGCYGIPLPPSST